MMGINLGVVTTSIIGTIHWSDEYELLTVRSDEAAFPVDVDGMSGSVKKEPSSLWMTVSLGVISNSINSK